MHKDAIGQIHYDAEAEHEANRCRLVPILDLSGDELCLGQNIDIARNRRNDASAYRLGIGAPHETDQTDGCSMVAVREALLSGGGLRGALEAIALEPAFRVRVIKDEEVQP